MVSGPTASAQMLMVSAPTEPGETEEMVSTLEVLASAPEDLREFDLERLLASKR
jgi:hypothetical protein